MTTMVSSEKAEQIMPWWLVLLEGIAVLIIGIMLLSTPAKTALVLWQFIGIYWLVKGIFSIVSIFIDSTAWGWKLFIGIVGIAAGILIVDHPISGAVTGTLALAYIIGIQGLIIGILQLIQGFQGGGIGPILLGGLSILLGGWVLFNAGQTALVLPWVFGVLGIIGGIAAIFMSFRLKKAAGA